ncbi:ABC transporter ATP-binding protein [Marinimicrobium alkaliphilum]|uniref:ABC transporter ATP-binding protein n=1 Tax=Marinimicrobium alkaliphilum TaxID=2202654 RepID=UPI000DBA4798|nr:ATP-binding cassette domain-containing protein [Marinimicrobium alkaliphilum]
MIEAQALAKRFPQKGRKAPLVAVRDVSLRAEDGNITGLLGPNGAGKSTTLRMLTGLIPPDSGSARVDGWDIGSDALKVRQNIGYLPHNAGIYPRLSARENIVYFAQLSGMGKTQAEARIDELVELLGMDDIIDRRTEGFSQGQRTKVGLARALVHEPQTLVLDEPTNGLDVMATRKLRMVLRQLRDRGHCILVSSHIMQDVTLLCDQVAIINEGVIAMEDSVAGILEKTGQTDFEDAFVVAIGESLENR